MTGPNTAAPPVSLTQAVAALQQKRGAKPRARTQADIVADNADTIIELVRRSDALGLRDHLPVCCASGVVGARKGAADPFLSRRSILPHHHLVS
ncbi:hypothetical protein SOQ14_03855 [Erythrobacter sp. T5W1-R]|uniref:hypothetical protein n=1 Tax=Erythrobacter sp. T5W1-R TaxID=3101752 RepID=UPI002AFFD877|nr:hypothetical protein [Erythrobacter sp. T5W1-R]MEA1618045.1 hypothetical protein [Erythrobacter sp. T5W1-R]